MEKAHAASGMGLFKNGTGAKRVGVPRAAPSRAYGCTFRPDQVHTFKSVGPPLASPRSGYFFVWPRAKILATKFSTSVALESL